jgi:galactose mutarotase-like enzyme
LPYLTTTQFLHSIVGRYCNRLPDTPITLPNGESFTPLQNGGAGTSLHGGPSSSGWDQKVFTNVSSSPSESLFSPAERKYLAGLVEQGQAGVWEYVSPHGEGGHLGKVRTQTAFVVEEGKEGEVGAVEIIYRAELVEGEMTALNMTHVSFRRFRWLDSTCRCGRGGRSFEIALSTIRLGLGI